ncbi:hypothetical protein MMC14_006246 [Varicellaria rhodocarpa]|nr:hypothetical protein [Varicellaria rhodocarpa]
MSTIRTARSVDMNFPSPISSYEVNASSSRTSSRDPSPHQVQENETSTGGEPRQIKVEDMHGRIEPGSPRDLLKTNQLPLVNASVKRVRMDSDECVSAKKNNGPYNYVSAKDLDERSSVLEGNGSWEPTNLCYGRIISSGQWINKDVSDIRYQVQMNVAYNPSVSGAIDLNRPFTVIPFPSSTPIPLSNALPTLEWHPSNDRVSSTYLKASVILQGCRLSQLYEASASVRTPLPTRPPQRAKKGLPRS